MIGHPLPTGGLQVLRKAFQLAAASGQNVAATWAAEKAGKSPIFLSNCATSFSVADGTLLEGPAVHSITVRASDGAGGTSTESFSIVVENAAPVISPSPTTQARQYSDPIGAVSIQVSDFSADTFSVSVQWRKDGGSFSSGLPDAGTLVGGLSLAGPLAGSGMISLSLTGIADLAPGYYEVRFTATDDDGSSSLHDVAIDVAREDARVAYSGTSLASTGSGSTAQVLLSATIQDITGFDPALSLPTPDNYAGDIRFATVTFKDRVSGAVLASGVPVVLVSGGDTTLGTATATAVMSLSGADAETFQIQVIVNGFYTRDDVSDDGLVTLSPAIPNSVTGGGFLRVESSAGTYSADVDSRVNLGFNASYTPNGSKPKGHANIVFRRTVGGAVHTFQIKSTAINSVGVNPSSPNRAEFNSKANLTDVTDPYNPVPIAGNLTLLATITDNGEPGTADTIGVTLYDKDGQLLFSNN
jgi:hypothetical protein